MSDEGVCTKAPASPDIQNNSIVPHIETLPRFANSNHDILFAGCGDDGAAVQLVPAGARRPVRVQHPLVGEGVLADRREPGRRAHPPQWA